MATMNVSLPEDLKSYVDERVAADSYQSSSEYVRELIRRDKATQNFRGLIRQGMESPVVGELDSAYFSDLKNRLRAQATGA